MICWVVLTEAARTGPRVGGRRVDVRVEIEDVDPQTRAEDDTRAERAMLIRFTHHRGQHE